MSPIKGKVGPVEMSWESVRGGSSRVRLGDGRELEVRWRKDEDGIWIELPGGVHGFDIECELSDEGERTYHVSQRGTDRLWSGVSFRRAGEESAAGAASAAAGVKKGLRVRAQMPGKVTRILVKVGAIVEKGQPLMVMEAMKMENEIRAQHAGEVSQVKVTEGQAVETGADLFVITALA